MKYSFYSPSELKAAGWLKRQLEIQAKGLSGNLDKIWPDIKDSAWIGGDREGWERVPYWLDGFIPLAYLLRDDDMISRAKRYIDAIIKAQRPDGWICPCKDEERPTYDTWATILISKTLTVYYECSKDERIPDVIYRTLKNYWELLKNKTIKLFDWGKFRWFETFIALNFLYSRYHEEWILSLAKILREQGADYSDYTAKWQRPMNMWTFETHVVNLAMMLKSEAVSYELLGEEYSDRAEYYLEILDKYNGTAVGTFAGDECLSGISPIQGTELCSVVELMYSYELLYAYTGDSKWAERLEKIAFNALPATLSDDMWAHQYDQLSNQIACIKFPGKAIFRTNPSDSHLFGLEPSYGCCTANFSQGFPKLALSAFMHSGNIIENVIPIPSVLNDGGRRISLETDYPFKNELKYSVSSSEDFIFKIRIPSFAVNLKVNGENRDTGTLSFDIAAGTKTQITVSFDTVPEFETRSNGLSFAKCGSLIFSVPISYRAEKKEYEKDGVIRKFPYCDYEYIPTSEWSYAYSSDYLAPQFRGVSEIPFSSAEPPAVIRTKVKKIDWGYEDGYDTLCAKLPSSLTPIGEEKEIELYPYGCAKLRMTELPIINK